MKRVLVITYYWPPSGGISVHRSLKLVKYLRQFGWEPVVYTAKNAHYPYYDPDNFKDVPADLEVIKKKIFEPFQLFKLLTGRKKEDSLNNIIHVRQKKRSILEELSIWIRGNFFIPDARSLWIRPSVRFLKKYLKKKPVDAIFADGPPHTNTRIATLISRKLNIPFLADFQDPWTQVDYYQHMKITRWAHKIHQRMEQELFKTANKITIASPTWKKELESIGASNVDVVYWGYDEDDFRQLKPCPDPEFTIVHTGLMGYDRNPSLLFKACATLGAEMPGFANDLQLKFAGQVDYSVEELIKDLKLAGSYRKLGTIPRKEALQITLNARVLLLPLNISNNIKGRMPGKFYEYLRARRPILNFGPGDSDVGQIIEKLNCGAVFDYDDSLEKVCNWLKLQYQIHLESRENNCIGDITQFSVAYQTKKVAGYLDEII